MQQPCICLLRRSPLFRGLFFLTLDPFHDVKPKAGVNVRSTRARNALVFEAAESTRQFGIKGVLETEENRVKRVGWHAVTRVERVEMCVGTNKLFLPLSATSFCPGDRRSWRRTASITSWTHFSKGLLEYVLIKSCSETVADLVASVSGFFCWSLF